MTYIRRLILALVLSAGLVPAFAQVPPPVPALPDTERRTTYSISGTKCACNVNFALYGDSNDFQNWIEVFLNGIRVNFNDSTFGWAITSPTGSLGSIPLPITNAVLTFNAVQTGTVQIIGARRPRRTSQFNEGAGVSTRNFNVVLSDLTAQNRELWDKTNDVAGRGSFAPAGETMALLPVLNSRKNMGACFDSNGNLTSCVAAASGTFAAGSGITFTGTNPTTISTATFSAGTGIAFTGSNPTVISFVPTAIPLAIAPQVRITLVSGLAVPTTDQAGIATIWVTPVGGNIIPLFNGSTFDLTTFSEVSQAASDTTKSPAAVGNNLIYDIFCWVDTGPTNRCTRGPAWTNDTTRSAGTALVLQNGIWLNSVSITNGPAASRGTYVGSCRSNGTATFDLKFGTAAAGGGQAWFSCWNMYNRAPAGVMVMDNNVAWTVTTPGPAALDAAGTGSGLGNRVSILHGIDEDAVDAKLQLRGISPAGLVTLQFGFCLDSISAFTARQSLSYIHNASLDVFHSAFFNGSIGLGFHFLQACEASSGASAQGRMSDTQGGITATVWW